MDDWRQEIAEVRAVAQGAAAEAVKALSASEAAKKVVVENRAQMERQARDTLDKVEETESRMLEFAATLAGVQERLATIQDMLSSQLSRDGRRELLLTLLVWASAGLGTLLLIDIVMRLGPP